MNIKLKLHGLFFSFISGTAVASAIIALSLQQINHSSIVERRALAQSAINEIDLILDDAIKSIRMASSLTPRICNTAMRRRLSKITIGIERVRVINI